MNEQEAQKLREEGFRDGRDCKECLRTVNDLTKSVLYTRIRMKEDYLTIRPDGERKLESDIENDLRMMRVYYNKILEYQKQYGLEKYEKEEFKKDISIFNEIQKEFCYYLASQKPWGQKQ